MEMAVIWCLLLNIPVLSALGNLNSSLIEPLSSGGTIGLHLQRSRGPCFPNPCLHQGNCTVTEGKPSCSCKPGFSGLLCQDAEVKLQCEEEYMKMLVRREVFDAMKVPLRSAHLRNKICKVSQQQEGGGSFFGAKLTGENHTACGSVIQVNGSHVSYTNVIELEQEVHKVITRSTLMRLNFSCVYAYKRVVGLSSPLRAMAEISQSAVKEGDFSVTMSLYENARYERTYQQDPPKFHLTDILYILLKIEGQDQVKYFFLGVEDCWSTPTSDPDHKTTHELIKKGCPRDETVTFLGEIGTSSEAKFSFQMFRFTNFSQVYLHCKVRLCAPDNPQPCTQECPSKQKSKRDLGENHGDVVSYGPIRLQTLPPLKAQGVPNQLAFRRLQIWIAGAGLSIGIAAAFVLTAVAKAVKK